MEEDEEVFTDHFDRELNIGDFVIVTNEWKVCCGIVRGFKETIHTLEVTANSSYPEGYRALKNNIKGLNYTIIKVDENWLPVLLSDKKDREVILNGLFTERQKVLDGFYDKKKK